jgi:HEAT repeat protein
MISSRDTRCPECRVEIDVLSSRPYVAKLLAALDHPIGEVRERAVRVLGDVGGRETREPLAKIAMESRDPYLAAVALRSLEHLLERFPDLSPEDWTQFTGPDRPIIVRVTATEIHKRQSGESRRAQRTGS